MSEDAGAGGPREPFPLPLTPTERVFLAGHRPGYPQDFEAIFEFEGGFDRARLEEALGLALARHALLTAKAPGGRAWVTAPEPEWPRVAWIPAQEPLAPADRTPLDPTRECGLRLRVQPGAGRTRVLLDCHHAVSDGAGLTAFVADWFIAYRAGLRGPAPPAWRPGPPTPLARRGALLAGRPRRNRDGSVGLLGRLRDVRALLAGGALVLAGDSPPPEPSPVRPPLLHRDLGPALLERLEAAGRRARATVNDLLVAALFGVLARHARDREGADPARILRVAIGTNLRRKSELAGPACNRVGVSYADLPVGACLEPGRLLAGYLPQAAAIREHDPGTLLWELMELAYRVPGLAPFLVGRGKAGNTASFTYLGRLDRFAGLRAAGAEDLAVGPGYRLCRVAVGPPLMRGTHWVTAVAGGPDALTVASRFDPGVFSAARREELMDALVAEIEALAAGGRPA